MAFFSKHESNNVETPKDEMCSKEFLKHYEDLLREKIDLQSKCNALETECSRLREEIEQLKSDNAQAVEKCNRLEEMYKSKQEEYAERSNTSGPLPDEQKDGVHTVLGKLDELKNLVLDTNYKDETIKSLHKEVQTLSQDVFSNISRPYLNAMIRIYNHLAGIADKARSEDELLYKKLYPSMLMVQDLLEDEFDATYFAPSIGDSYEPKSHYAVQSIPTDDETLAGKISVCRQGGFRKSDSGKVLKQAVVIVYCLNKK